MSLFSRMRENRPVVKHLLTLEQANAQRNRRYHRQPNLRLRNADDIYQFVDDAGLCLLFPVQGIQLPNVYQAVAGFEKDMTPKHDDPSLSLTWGTKDRSLDQRRWYYGKLIKGKATLVSLKLLPSVYALSQNFGDPDDYLSEYEAGTLTAEAKAIYEALLHHGRMHTIDLKRKANLYGDSQKAKFDKALTELQMGLKVLPIGVAEAGAWRYAFIFDILSRWFPDQTAQARDLSRAQARVNILRAHLRNAIYITQKDASRLFRWTAKETAVAVEQLIAEGVAGVGQVIQGLESEVVVFQG